MDSAGFPHLQGPPGYNCCAIGCRELQAQEALQNGQLSGGDGVPDLQPGVLASQAMIEKILGEDPRWQGKPRLTSVPAGESRALSLGGCSLGKFLT